MDTWSKDKPDEKAKRNAKRSRGNQHEHSLTAAPRCLDLSTHASRETADECREPHGTIEVVGVEDESADPDASDEGDSGGDEKRPPRPTSWMHRAIAWHR